LKKIKQQREARRVVEGSTRKIMNGSKNSMIRTKANSPLIYGERGEQLAFVNVPV